MPEPWASVDAGAKHPGVPNDSICRWIDNKRLPAHEIGRLWKFRLSGADAWARASGEDSQQDQGGREGPR
jgi:excisionase family DNA binding protein